MTTQKDNKTSAKQESAQKRQHSVNEILTSGKTTGEILIAIAALYPAFSKKGAAE